MYKITHTMHPKTLTLHAIEQMSSVYWVVFAILTIINFVVITKGAGRVRK